jgi:hypothetical protein
MLVRKMEATIQTSQAGKKAPATVSVLSHPVIRTPVEATANPMKVFLVTFSN